MTVQGRIRPRRRRVPAGAALSLGLTVVALLAQPMALPAGAAAPVPASARGTAAASHAPRTTVPPWQSYVETPSQPDVCPVAVVSTSGSVTGAANLLCGASGGATLTLADGGAAPAVVLDYGKEVGGVPYFAVSAETGSPTLAAAYSEGGQYLGTSGDGAAPWGDGDGSRSDAYPVSAAGTITNRYVQGGERYERISLSTPGSLTLSGAGVHYIADRTQADGYGGYFVSSSDELNKIWYDGAYTLQTDLAPAHSLPGQLGRSATARSTPSGRRSTTAPVCSTAGRPGATTPAPSRRRSSATRPGGWCAGRARRTATCSSSTTAPTPPGRRTRSRSSTCTPGRTRASAPSPCPHPWTRAPGTRWPPRCRAAVSRSRSTARGSPASTPPPCPRTPSRTGPAPWASANSTARRRRSRTSTSSAPTAPGSTATTCPGPPRSRTSPRPAPTSCRPSWTAPGATARSGPATSTPRA